MTKHEVAGDIILLLAKASTSIRVNVLGSDEEEQRFLKSALDCIETSLVHISNYANHGLFKD